jgi:hypothetical protein
LLTSCFSRLPALTVQLDNFQTTTNAATAAINARGPLLINHL